MKRRTLQVSRLIQETLGMVLEREVRDPRLELVTITKVQTTDDLRQARVFISVLETDREQEVIRALRRATGFMRRELGTRLNLRYTPALTFVLDHSFAQTQKLLETFDEIAAEQEV
jgi:ribosome-binding factor A